MIGFYFFSEDFYNGDISFNGEEGENMCSSLFLCLLSTIYFGLKNGGGISESLNPISFNNS